MSLRGRLLLVVVLLNLAVVVVVQSGAVWLHREQWRQQQERYAELLQTIMADTYPDRANRVEHQWVRELLAKDGFPQTVFRDVVVSSGAAAGTEGFVDLNPMGTAHRRDGFAMADVRAGIRRAKSGRAPVRVGEGLCVPIEVNGRVDLGAWYVPVVGLAAPIPIESFAVPVLLVTVLIAVLAYSNLGRTVVRPLERMRDAAARMGGGEYGVRVEAGGGAPELNVLVDAFNAMSEKVSGHTEELQREVDRATLEAARRERALVMSSRLAAMGTLAAGIAHEINNPIGGMINAVRSLQRRDDLDARSKQYLELILEGLDRVGAIARRVLDFSPRQIEAAPFSVAAAIEGARVLVEHRCHQQGVEFVVNAGVVPDVTGDRHEIQQVLLNCFLNSLDVLAGRPGGRIEVRASFDGDVVAIEVADNGPGASPDTLARVLDPFFSAKGSPDASGLGLFISYSILKNHGGDLTVESPPGQGFLVRLRLPVRASG